MDISQGGLGFSIFGQYCLNNLSRRTFESITMRYVPSAQQLKARATSVKAWELPKQKSALAPDHVWTNQDMDPVKIEHQTWTLWTWIAYWATDVINLGTWQTASAILAVGLTWRDAIPIVSQFILDISWRTFY